jgi:hypothetical protein
MKRLLVILFILFFVPNSCLAFQWFEDNDIKAVKHVLNSQVKYANKMNFDKFIKTFDSNYINSDGFNLDVYSSLIKDAWKTFDNMKYFIDIKNIEIKDDCARVEVLETSFAEINSSKAYKGELKSQAITVYQLKKINGMWKVVSDSVLDETTTMLYGLAKDLEIELVVPNNIKPNEEYCASLSFNPPKNVLAIASIASDIIEYPQKPTEEVFRAMPEDNILERLFTSNSKNANEYIVASIGLTETSVCNLDIRFSLVGFGYKIKRVNIVHDNGVSDVKNE